MRLGHGRLWEANGPDTSARDVSTINKCIDAVVLHITMHSIVGLELVACGKLVFLANQRIEALSSAMAPKAKAVAKPQAKAGGRRVVIPQPLPRPVVFVRVWAVGHVGGVPRSEPRRPRLLDTIVQRGTICPYPNNLYCLALIREIVEYLMSIDTEQFDYWVAILFRYRVNLLMRVANEYCTRQTHEQRRIALIIASNTNAALAVTPNGIVRG